MSAPLEMLAILPAAVDTPLPEGLIGVPGAGAARTQAVMAPPPGRLPTLPGARRRHLAQAVVRRQARLESLMLLGPVLPVRPGTLMTPDQAARAQADEVAALSSALDEVAGRVQVQLTVDWNREAATDAFDRGPGVPLDDLAASLSQEIADEIAPVVADAITLPRAGTDTLYAAVLMLDQARLWGLDAAVERIDAIWTEGLRLRLVGPAPVASFTMAAFAEVSAGDVQRAAAALGLAGTSPLAPDALSTARRQALMQPGVDPAAIRDAADLLDRLSRRPGGGQAGGYMLTLLRDGPPVAGRARMDAA